MADVGLVSSQILYKGEFPPNHPPKVRITSPTSKVLENFLRGDTYLATDYFLNALAHGHPRDFRAAGEAELEPNKCFASRARASPISSKPSPSISKLGLISAPVLIFAFYIWGR